MVAGYFRAGVEKLGLHTPKRQRSLLVISDGAGVNQVVNSRRGMDAYEAFTSGAPRNVVGHLTIS